MNDAKGKMISRRNLLMKTGLAAGAIYVAPTLAGFDVARASGGSGGGGGGGSSSGPSAPGHSPSHSSGPSRQSGPSRPAGNQRGGLSRPSGPSRPSRPRATQANSIENLYRRLFGTGVRW